MVRDYEKLRTQDKRDAQSMAYVISAPLHHCVGTPQCSDPPGCDLCSNAARLAVQHYRPVIERRVVQSLMDSYDVRCPMPHPGDG